MSAAECGECGKPCPDNAYLCNGCTTALRLALAQIADLVEALPDAVVRLVRMGPGNGGRRSRVTALPWNDRASKVQLQLTTALTTWARHIAEQRPAAIQLPPAYLGPVHPRQCEHASCRLVRSRRLHPILATWISGQVDWLRRQPEAHEAYGDLTECADELQAVVDSPPTRWYAGQCDACHADLYVDPGAAVTQCGECQCLINLVARRDQLLELARDHLAHAELAGRALSAFGVPVTSAQIRGWIRRERLVQRGTGAPTLSYDADGQRVQRARALYRLGDVIDLAEEAAAKRTKEKAS